MWLAVKAVSWKSNLGGIITAGKLNVFNISAVHFLPLLVDKVMHGSGQSLVKLQQECAKSR